jgi:hypothetical protein
MREEDNQDFEKAWQGKFADWETPPPADALAKLQAELSSPKRFSGRRGWILRSLVVGVLLLMFIPQSKDDRLQIKDNRLLTIDDRQNINTKNNTNKELQKTDNQRVMNYSDSVINPLQKTDNQGFKNYADSTINPLQKTDNQVVRNCTDSIVNPLQKTDNQVIRNYTDSTINPLQKTDNQVVTYYADSTINPLQKTDNQVIKNYADSTGNPLQKTDNQIVKHNTDSTINPLQKTDNQVVRNYADSTINPLQKTDNQIVRNYADSIVNPLQKTDNQVVRNYADSTINPLQKTDNQSFKYLINLLKPLDLHFEKYSFSKLNFANLKIDSLLAQKIISPRWFVSINFAPNFTYKQINPNPLDSIWIRDFEATRGLSRANMGWQVNVQISRQWHKNWEVYAGLGYARYQTHFNYQRWTRLGFNLYENVSGSEFTLIPQFKKDTINQTYVRHNGQLEAGIARRIGGNRFGHWLRLGIGASFQQNLSGFGQVSYQFLPRLSPRWQLSLSPYFLYQLNNQQLSDIGFQGKGYHLGFQVGIRYTCNTP